VSNSSSRVSWLFSVQLSALVFRQPMVAGDFAKILLSLDASAVDSMLLQKLAHALRFDILISFLYRLSFVW